MKARPLVWLATIMVAAVAAVTVGCTTPPPPPTAETSRYGGSLVVGVSGESSGWSPQNDRWGPGPTNVARAIFDPLVVVGDDGTWHPWLAESFTSQDNNKTWIITIRRGIQFSNGEPVDGHAVVYNLEAFKKAPLTAFAFQPVQTITKVDDYTVAVGLDQEWANFPVLFTGQAGFIVAPEQLRTGDTSKPIGSGPFVMKTWIRDSKTVTAKNPTYWRTAPNGDRLPYLDNVEFRPLVDESSRSASLLSGDLDVMFTNSPSVQRRINQGDYPTDKYTVITDTSEGDEANVVLNTQTGTFTSEPLRKALQLATDRSAIVATFDNLFDVADGPFTNKSSWWTDPGWPTPDPTQASRLVEEWSAANGGQKPAVRLATLANNDGLQIAQLLQQQWNAVGFDTQIESLEETRFSAALTNGAFDAIIFNYWNGTDPDVNYHFWTGKNIGPAGSLSLNFPRWTNPEADTALDQGRAETDSAARKAIYAELWKQWAEHVPYLWLYHIPWVAITRTEVNGINEVNMPNGGTAQPLTWGTVNLSNTWLKR